MAGFDFTPDTSEYLERITATARVILNVCSSPIEAREQFEAIRYASATLVYFADSALDTLDVTADAPQRADDIIRAEVCHA
ncbi:hypothetical protein ABZO35_04635 [Burkholderia pseudomallei]|uniref:hypothetical protein n=1 Tax=Burkholderia pseudomallei TaxID=28450 RepID=UPI00344BF020